MEYKKKYKNALEWARQVMNGETGFIRNEVEEIFPELKESEGEKIRKKIIATIHLYYGEPLEDEAKEMIDWLEKQVGQSKKVSIWKHWKDGIAGNGEGKPIYLIKDGYTYSINSCLCFECDYIELSELDKLLSEKQGEQNPIEEYNITGISSKHADGKLGEMIKNMESANKVEPKDYRSIDPHFFKSADKIEKQPSQWNISDYRTWQYIVSDVLTKHDGIGQYLDNGECKKIAKYMQENWSKKLSLELNSAWSEDDEMIALNIEQVMNCASLLNIVPEKIDKIRTWLKSLKDRCTWKPSDEQMDALQYVYRNLNPPLSDKLGWNSLKTLEMMYQDLKKLKEE